MAQQRFHLSPEFKALRKKFTLLNYEPTTTPADVQRAFKLTDKQMVQLASWDDSDFWFIYNAWYMAHSRLPKVGRRIARRNRKRNAR